MARPRHFLPWTFGKFFADRRIRASATNRLQDWLDRWQPRRCLEELDDHRLSDIGLTRQAARAETAKPFWRR